MLVDISSSHVYREAFPFLVRESNEEILLPRTSENNLRSFGEDAPQSLADDP